MSKYDPLRQRLQTIEETAVVLSFEQIEKEIGQPLPKSAHEYDAWWNNEDLETTTHTQCKAWMLAGFDAEVDRMRRIVTFRRR